MKYTKNKEVNDILNYLHDIANNNTREWFHANRDRYDDVRTHFEEIVRGLLVRIGQFDSSISHLEVKDCVYRFYRDVRFSQDKAPYKRHFGCYINAKGRKALRGGYYFHLQPDENMIAGGTWYLPGNILREVRYSILEDIDGFRDIVEKPEFREAFPQLGYDSLKTMPKGFPKDFAYPEYLRIKVYSCFNNLSNSYFDRSDWLDDIARKFEVSKPFIDFINDTIDDYAEE